MKEQQAILNRVWSHVLLEELSRLGVEHICIAPGSRSTPLTLEADANPNFELHHHFDERGLGFLALGLAKASGQPVAIVVTSGTAVANLLPAVAEAHLTGEKLVLLTADRPIELVASGANQAIVQSGIFSSHTLTQLDLPAPTEPLALSWLLTSVDDVLWQQQIKGGPVHINCPFPEPLYTSELIDYSDYFTDHLCTWNENASVYCTRTSFNPASISKGELSRISDKCGVIILGQLSLPEAQLALQVAQQLKWPVFCDPQSGVSSAWAHFDLWLQDERLRQQLQQCDCVVQISSRIVSKRLNAWLKEQVSRHAAEYIYCSPSSDRNNQYHLPQQHWLVAYDELLMNWLDCLSVTPLAINQDWARDLGQQLEKRVAFIDGQFEREAGKQPLNELNLVHSITDWSANLDLFIGNSLIVRLVDMFSRLSDRNVFTNRGASGIDGLLATAVGVQRFRNKPLVALLGDTSLLYDLNALALLAHQSLPLVVIVTNNDGGAIFDLLPVPDAQKANLYQMPHGFDFFHAAKQFGLGYAAPENHDQLVEIVNQHLTQGEGGLVVEVKTPSNQASTMIKQMVQGIYAL